MRVIINMLMAAAVAYGAVLLLVFLFQPRLIYFPQVEREHTATPRAAELEAAGERDGVIVLPPGARVAYVAVGCAPVGSGDGGMA